MRTNRAIVCVLGGLTLATLVGPASAQPVTYQVDLLYEKIVDGIRPREIVRVTMRAVSAQAAQSICDHSMMRVSKTVLEKNPHALGLTGNWMAGGGECVRDEDGNIEMTVEASAGGSN